VDRARGPRAGVGKGGAGFLYRLAPEARGRGWGKAVLDSCIAWVLRTGAHPLYVVPERNTPSIRLAESTGFVDTGAREFAVEAVRQAE